MPKTRFMRPLTLHLRTKVSAFSRTCSVSPMMRRVGRSYKSELDLAAWRRREASFSVLDLSSKHSCLKEELPSSAALLNWSANWIGFAKSCFTKSAIMVLNVGGVKSGVGSEV